MSDFWHVVVLILGLIALYLLLSSTSTNGILQTLSGAGINGVKALQGR